MRVRKRSLPQPFSSSLCPTTPLDPQPHNLPFSSQQRRAPDSKAGGPDAADLEQSRKDNAKANMGSESSLQPEEPNEGNPSSSSFVVEVKDDLPHTYNCSNPSISSPLLPPPPPKLGENHRRPQPRPSSDLTLTIIRVNDGWICSDGVVSGGGGGEDQKKTRLESCGCMYPSIPTEAHDGLEAEEDTKGKKWRFLIGNSRSGSRLGAETAADEIGANWVLYSSSSSNQVGRWCEEEKALPLKKRRRYFEDNKSGEKIMASAVEELKKMRTNQKWQVQPEEEGAGDDDEEGEKRGGAGGVVMSRCSRGDGKGWRCSQITLGGYSLCEHHLLNSRIRKQLLRKKKTKIRMVKTRSISSILLGQTENGISSVVNGSSNGGIV